MHINATRALKVQLFAVIVQGFQFPYKGVITICNNQAGVAAVQKIEIAAAVGAYVRQLFKFFHAKGSGTDDCFHRIRRLCVNRLPAAGGTGVLPIGVALIRNLFTGHPKRCA